MVASSKLPADLDRAAFGATTLAHVGLPVENCHDLADNVVTDGPD